MGQQKKQATFQDKNSPATSRDQKKSSNISGQTKIMQPLRKKINTLPLRTRNITQNHATSWDQKKSSNLSDKKNHATSWDKKIMQPLKTKQITGSMGQIAANLVYKASNCSKWHQICTNRSK